MTADHFVLLQNTANPVQDVRHFLRQVGRLDTLKHVTQVRAAGRRLARRFEAPLPPVDLACLAHDLAAVVPQAEVAATAEAWGVALSASDRAIPAVIHGPLAAAVLERRLGVADADVLNAVRYHTTLRAGASPLEQLVFVADKIALDPTSRDTGFHAALLAAKDAAPLPELCLIYLDWVVTEAPSLGWQVHPNAQAAWEALRVGEGTKERRRA